MALDLSKLLVKAGVNTQTAQTTIKKNNPPAPKPQPKPAPVVTLTKFQEAAIKNNPDRKHVSIKASQLNDDYLTSVGYASGDNINTVIDTPAVTKAYNDAKAKVTNTSQPAKSSTPAPSSGGGSSRSGSSTTSSTAPSTGGGGGGGGGTAPGVERPDLNIPGLSMRRGASVAYQLAKLLGRDSLLMQQAKVKADETGVAGGTIHSSDQAGAAMRAMTDVASPIAQAEANLVASTDLQNWQSKATEMVTVYKAKFEDYLRDKGYQHEKAVEMARMQTSLNQTLMNNIGGLLNNPDIEFGDEVKKKLVDIFNAGLDNNNAILDLNLRY